VAILFAVTINFYHLYGITAAYLFCLPGEQCQEMKRNGIGIFRKSYEDKPVFYQMFRKTYM